MFLQGAPWGEGSFWRGHLALGTLAEVVRCQSRELPYVPLNYRYMAGKFIDMTHRRWYSKDRGACTAKYYSLFRTRGEELHKAPPKRLGAYMIAQFAVVGLYMG